MKANPEKIVPTIEYLDKKFTSQFVNDIFENLKLNPFVYNSQAPDYFKLVLNWNLYLKSNETTKDILKVDADQEFVVQLDDNNDKDMLVMLIRNSELRFEETVQNILKPTGLQYRFKYYEYDQIAESIIALVHRK